MSLRFTFIPDTRANSTDIYEVRGTTTQTGRTASSQVTYVEGFVYSTTGGLGLSYYLPYSVVRTNMAIQASSNTDMISSPNVACNQLVSMNIPTNTITCNSIKTPWGGVGVYMIKYNVTTGNTSFLYNAQYGLLASRKNMGFVDDLWVCLLWFKAVLYPNSNYTGTPLATIHATSSTTPISQTSASLYGSPNLRGSVRVYYQGVEQILATYS